MSKYDPLYKWLCTQAMKKVTKIPLTFEQVEAILGFVLPDTARIKPQWWANEADSSRHVQRNAWMNAGYETRHLDLKKEQVEFVRV
jgi:hypothetical protein